MNPPNESGWTLLSLKEHFEAILAERRSTLLLQLEAMDKAVNKAEAAQSAYNARSNEFRAALDDQAKQMLSRVEADMRFKDMAAHIEAQAQAIIVLQREASRGDGGNQTREQTRSNSQWMIALGVTVLIAVAGWVSGLIFYLATKH